MRNIFFHIISLLSLTLANPQNYGSPNSKSSSALPAPTAAASTSPNSRVHTVEVGNNAFVFKPNTLNAKFGDVIQFKVFPTHSLARSSFADPCQPMSGTAAIWSGFSSNENTFFTVTVNDTMPIWLYCAAPTHCQAGMAMVINPPSGGNDIAAYQAAAKSVSDSGTPAHIAGGVFGKVAAAASANGSSGASSPTAASSAASASPSDGSARGLVGDVVLLAGAVVVAAAFMV